ncbi:MAG: rhodanese-like domain-containing protein [Sulfurimicrobium sp.]|nr:rhodanese-like domain-containing protein [Sulfurimicrobium sp.]MDO9190579.1 rhodanese-like domain-containing protein [Sulfurimicrobium sp.]MDP1704683.1 rhodanese-like domain-containing protein [Sulfurimicrobium sp.]MDP1897497.1 rhodanese-like domain-containing protein [Sulfurimicrobium sp.]MDP2197225.1 rhodanese-like domain-containing protein [Sulfurimicrobium sp.]
MDRTISPADFKKLRNSTAVALLDVRRKSDFDASHEKILGANWCDPDSIEAWAGKVPMNREVVLYCMRGRAISDAVVDALQAKGYRARFIEGGIEGWKAAGGDTVNTRVTLPAD